VIVVECHALSLALLPSHEPCGPLMHSPRCVTAFETSRRSTDTTLLRKRVVLRVPSTGIWLGHPSSLEGDWIAAVGRWFREETAYDTRDVSAVDKQVRMMLLMA